MPSTTIFFHIFSFFIFSFYIHSSLGNNVKMIRGEGVTSSIGMVLHSRRTFQAQKLERLQITKGSFAV